MKSIFRIFLRKFNFPKQEKADEIISQLSRGGKIIFGFFFAIALFSTIGLLLLINDNFKISIPAEGGTLIEGVIGTPRFINPVLATSDADKDMTALIFSGLVKIDQNGKILPDLAESYSISEDGLSYTFIIRKDAIFHDEKPVTGEDVLFTIQKFKDPSIQSPRRANFEGVEVEQINEREIKFSLKKPYAPFINYLSAGILPKHIWKNINNDQFAFSGFNSLPVGSGPYEVEKITKDKNDIPMSYELTPFNKHKSGKVYISKIILNFYQSEKDMLDAFANGEIKNMGGIGPENLPKTIINKDYSGANVVESALPRIFAVFYNSSESKALKESAVRKALDMAIDRERIVNEIIKGHGTPITSVDLLKASSGYYNPQEAINILSKAGWTETSEEDRTLYKKDKSETTTLSISLATSNQPELKKVSEIIKENWENIGVKVSLDYFESGDLNQEVIRPRKFDCLLFGFVSGWDLDLFPFWHSSQRNYPGLNVAMYADKDADKLMEDIRTISDEKTKKETLGKLAEIIKRDIPASFLYIPNYIYISTDEIKGIELNSISKPSDRWNGIYNWYISEDKIWKKINLNL